LEELKPIHQLLEDKDSKEQLRKRVACAYQRREQRRRRLFGDFAERIRKEKRARFKKERKRLLVRVHQYESVAVTTIPDNGTLVDHVVTRAFQPLTEDWIPPDETEDQICEIETAPPAKEEQKPEMKERDARRLLRALKKLVDDGMRKKGEKPVIEQPQPFRAFVTVDDQVGVIHLQSRNGVKEEL
jgi:hypothetical protein